MYDEALAARVRAALSREKAVAEIKMFGGLCFTIRGNMCCGVLGHDLIVRADTASTEEILQDPNARPFDFTGRPMKGIFFVSQKGLRGAGLKKWLALGLDRGSRLPSKA